MKKYFYFVVFYAIVHKGQKPIRSPRRTEVASEKKVTSIEDIIAMEKSITAQGYYSAKIINFQFLRLES